MKGLRVSLTATLLLCCGVLAAAAPGEPSSLVNDSPTMVGESLARAFNERNEQRALASLDVHALAVRAARSVFDDADQQAGFVRGMTEHSHEIFQGMFKELDTTHGSAKFMHAGQRGGSEVALVRINLGDKGTDYLEYVVERDAQSHFRAVDWYQLSRGELMSASLGAIGRLMIDPNPGLIKSLFGVTQFDANLVEELKAIGTLTRTGNYAGALAAYAKLPPAIADSRVLLLQRVALASLSGQSAEYNRLLGVLAARYPNDASAALMLIDYYLSEHQIDKTLQEITLVEQRVGSDALTNTLRANVYYVSGSYDQAVRFANIAVGLEPDFKDAYYSLAQGYIGSKRYPEAVGVFKSLSVKFGSHFSRKGFESNPQFSGLVHSPAFNQWLPAQARTPEPAH